MDRLLEATRRVEQSHFWWIGFRRFLEPLIAAATRGVHNPLVLDCACGTGANLRLLGRYGKAFGFDISPSGLEYAREYGESRVVSASITNVPFQRGNHSIFGDEVRRSTRRRLRRVLSRAGFTVERLTYTNASLFPLMLAVRTAQRMTGLATPEEAGTDIVLPPRPLNAALAAVLRLEARALRVVDMPIGSSLLAVARK